MSIIIRKQKFFLGNRTALWFTALGVCVSDAALYAVKHRETKTQESIIQKEVKYVFFSADGKPITLSEQEVYGIRQLQEDGVLNSVIGEKFDMSPVMVSRVINSIKAL